MLLPVYIEKPFSSLQNHTRVARSRPYAPLCRLQTFRNRKQLEIFSMFSIPRGLTLPMSSIRTRLRRRKPRPLNFRWTRNLASAFRLLYLTRFSKLHMVRKIKSPFGSCWLPVGLCFFISLDGLPPATAQNLPAQINIVVVAGEGATSPVRQRVSQDPAVRIEDDDHHPVAGVSVVFAVPVSGNRVMV